MLTIRDEQMQVLGAEMERSFMERLTRTIASLFPVCVPSNAQNAEGQQEPQGYGELVEGAVKRAEQFHIEKENDIAAFVILTMAARNGNEAGSDFLSWTHPIIVSEDIAGDAKIPLIEHQLLGYATADSRSARVLEMIRGVRATA